MPNTNVEGEPKQDYYPDGIAAEVYKVKKRATDMFHNDHDDGDTAIYMLLDELAPIIKSLITAEKRKAVEEAEQRVINHVASHIGAAKITNPYHWEAVNIQAGALQRTLDELTSTKDK